MRHFLLVILSFFLAGFCFAEDSIGELSYLEGGLKVVRNGNTLRRGVTFGFGVEQLDQFTTSSDGYAEVEVYPSTGVSGTVKIQPNTSFYFDLSNLREGKGGTLELLTGSVGLSVKKLAGRSRMDIRTRGTVMGVRGTTFQVIIAVNGDILVTCEEGRVECRDDSGSVLYAAPGRVVERTEDAVFRNIPITVSSLSEFRKNWNAEKIEAFKANAGRVLKYYSERYLELRDQFIEGYQNLLTRRDVIDKWIREDREGRTGGTAEMMQEKKALFDKLANVRKVLFIFEKIYYRVEELYEYYQEGYGRGLIRPGLTAAGFYKMVERDRGVLQEYMSSLRYIMKLYALRNGGELPFDSFTEFADEDDFFGDGSF
jgi:hypothetical protein